MTRTDASLIDAKAVAASLLDGAEVAYTAYGNAETRRVSLPDGRVATLAVVFDEDSGIGEWIRRDGSTESHHDDCFGTFTWRDDSRSPRPSGFDGRARVLRPRDNGARIADPVWWQPPAEVDAEHLPELERAVRAYFETGDWFHVGLVVALEEDGAEVGSGSLWGVDWDYPGSGNAHVASMVAELLDEAGIGKASTVGVSRWARDPLEAVARRLTDEDEDSPEYAERLRDVVAWWDNIPDDWDAYGGPMTDRIELDYLSHRRACEAVEREKNGEARA